MDIKKDFKEQKTVQNKLKKSFSKEELEEIKTLLNPVTWAEKYLCDPMNPNKPLELRWYQKEILNSKKRKRVIRCGRRVGKTISMITEILWKLYTRQYRKLVLITPYKSQIQEIWGVLSQIIENTPIIENSIKRKVNNPHEIDLYNGSSLKAFTAGSKSSSKGANIRSLSAHDIYLDEADYLGPSALDAIEPLLLTSPETTLWASSTPTGRRETFYKWCINASKLGFAHFHFPSMESPNWISIEDARKKGVQITESTEYYFRQKGESFYNHEILADFGDEEEGVFKANFLDNNIYEFDEKPEDATLEYYNPGYKQNEKNVYIMGVDWNNSVNGTQIVITEYLREPTKIKYYEYDDSSEKSTKVTKEVKDKYRLFYRCSIAGKESTQVASVNKIIELLSKFKINHIYCDQGFGQCVDPNTLLYTHSGIKKIIDVNIGDLVLTHEGIFKKVLNKITNKELKVSYKIKPKKCLPTILSEEHPFLTYRTKDRFNNIKINEKKLQWRKCKEINNDKDFIAIPKTKELKYNNEFFIDLVKFLGKDLVNLQFDNKYVWLNSSYKVKNKNFITINELSNKINISTSTIVRINRKLKNNIKLTNYELINYNKFKYLFNINKEIIKIPRYINILSEDFQRIYGWYLAEGNCNNNSIEFSQNIYHNIEEFNLLKRSLSNLFNHCNISEYIKNTNVKQIFLFSKIISKFFEKIGGKYSENKKIYFELMPYAKSLNTLIRSFIIGDGCIKKNGISISITSFSLIFQLRQIFIDNGILPNIYFIKKRKEHHKDQLRIDIFGNQNIINRVNNFLNINIKNIKRINRINHLESKNYFFVPINSLELIDKKNNLVDIQVEDSHSFYGNGIILHNTNIELLHEYGKNHKELKLDKKLVPVDFGKNIETINPLTKILKKEPIKPFIVYTSVHEIEKGNCILPLSEDDDGKLISQMRAFTIKKHSQTGMPIFSQGNEHILIAWLLSIVGFHLEYSTLIKPEFNINDVNIGRVKKSNILMPYLEKVDRKNIRDKGDKISELFTQKTDPKPIIPGNKITTDPGFYNDTERESSYNKQTTSSPWGSEIKKINYFNINKNKFNRGSPSGRKLI